MTTYILIFASACALWLWLTLLAALNLASAVGDLYKALKPKQNRRKHTLGKWLRFHGQIY